MVGLTSAAGILSLLDEKDADLKVYALTKLNLLVEQFWAEISEAISKIEVLYEDESFSQRELAALVASKVYYYLGEYQDSLTFALGAGNLFDLNSKTEYVETIVAKALDKYVALRVQQSESPKEEVVIDPRLTSIVDRMFQRCLDDRELHQAIGIALESRRLDRVESIISTNPEKEQLMQYTLKVAMTLVQSKEFRNQVLRVLVELYRGLAVPDYLAVCECLVFLNDSLTCADILATLLSGTEDQTLIAYQISFSLLENATQDYLRSVLEFLSGKLSPLAAADATTAESNPKLKKIQQIFSGEVLVRQQLEFLFRNNHVDEQILTNTKTAVEQRQSVFHTALFYSNAFMNCGTTNDNFLRKNIEFLSRATNWSKFSATASLGIINKGQVEHALQILSPYLPQAGVNSSPYTEGGSLFALGLIHSNHGKGATKYLSDALKASQNEVVQHGAALGLGVAAMATDDETIYEELKAVLFTDNAVAGEACGLAIGLVLLGSGSSKAIEELLQYAHETQHEKIIRGIAIGISFIMYGKEEEADVLIEQLIRDKDPILRYGAMFTIALAYAGTGNNRAIRRILHVAVSDASDDVRRAAVIALGFLLFRTPTQVPKVVQLLAESYNPHVRYGATLAVGISCAGTGLAEAVALLEPLTKDTTDFVRQGALIALAMVLQQQNEVLSSKVPQVRKQLADIIAEKHEEPPARLGAILAQGIMDASGQNAAISLQSRSGHANMSAIVGLAVFAQMWYWYPLTLFLSLSFTPTVIIGLNKDLEVPKLDFVSNTKPSLFAYPPHLAAPVTSEPTKVATAVLSTTAKALARAKKSEKEKGKDDDKMEVVEPSEQEKPAQEKPADETQPKKKEENFQILPNPARVHPFQFSHVKITDGARYVPILPGKLNAITILKDTRPTEPEELVNPKPAAKTETATTEAPAAEESGAAASEPTTPAPFLMEA